MSIRCLRSPRSRGLLPFFSALSPFYGVHPFRRERRACFRHALTSKALHAPLSHARYVSSSKDGPHRGPSADARLAHMARLGRVMVARADARPAHMAHVGRVTVVTAARAASVHVNLFSDSEGLRLPSGLKNATGTLSKRGVTPVAQQSKHAHMPVRHEACSAAMNAIAR